MVLLVALVLTSIYALHRLALHCERRGWIYYRSAPRPPGVAGLAMMEAASLFEPELEYVIEATRSVLPEHTGIGDPPG